MNTVSSYQTSAVSIDGQRYTQTLEPTVANTSPTVRQALGLMSIFANNVDWEDLDPAFLQRIIDHPREAGAQFKAFLRNTIWSVFTGFIEIDRTVKFDPALIECTENWRVVSEDERSLALTRIDLSKVLLQNYLKAGEEDVSPEEWCGRLAESGNIPLDAAVWATFEARPSTIPEAFKEAGYLNFMGTILRYKELVGYPALYWDDKEGWCFFVDFNDGNPLYDDSRSLVISA
ncbi:MAG: hypothetical protein JWL88_341 [Parcubacteria group bacterium]|nr:hypothetical protein [Parcubacteria group bacterium]